MAGVADAVSEVLEAALSSSDRSSLPDSAFVFPKDKRYPIHDLAHARNALARCSGKPEEAQVKAAVYKRYPQLKTQEADVLEASFGGMVKCPECGVLNVKSAAKCKNCGHDMKQVADKAKADGRSDVKEAVLSVFEAADSMAKASTPEPFSRSKTSNWVAKVGGLPAYVQHIAHDLMEKRGKSESNAIQMAIGIVKRWCRGGGNVDANTKAAACKAAAEWEAKKARSHVQQAMLMEVLEADCAEPSLEDLRVAEATEVPCEDGCEDCEDCREKAAAKRLPGRHKGGKFADLPTLATGRRTVREAVEEALR